MTVNIDDRVRIQVDYLDDLNITDAGFKILEDFFADLKDALRPEPAEAQENADA